MLVHLEPADREAPALIAKVTRDERHNDRLATEASALPAVAALGSLGELIVPRLVGAGPVGRLWTAIETREAGRPLPGALRSNPDQAVVDRVVDGLTALSVASARDVPGVALATPLSALAERYRQTYVPSAAAGATLDRLLAPIARAARIPIVAQHGDPGSWNMLLAPDGRIVVLDWESFEPDGPPLWDLWHLVRAITLDVDTSIVPRRHATRLVRTFLGTGRQNDQVVRATARYRQDVAVDDDLIVPLLVFGWLHRALKESTRMAPDRVGHGPTARFVAALLSSPDAPGLRRIMATGAAI